MRNRPNPSAGSKQNIRIIGGQWRGRKLPVLSEDGLRPTGDRVRETLFNWLMPWINGAHVLDMFSGTGALGFESLSRGATHSYMFELNTRAYKLLQENAALLGANCTPINSGVIEGVIKHVPDASLDVVFMDPPFAADLWMSAFEVILPKLKPRALVYVEAPKGMLLAVPDRLEQLKSKVAGQVHYQLYQLAL